jgi:predicted nucleic acid-binding protein
MGSALRRVTLDSSVLLGSERRELVAAAALRYFTACWSPWIVSELVRKRTEWVAERALNEGVTRPELRRRLKDSRARVNNLVTELSLVFVSVNYAGVGSASVHWLPKDRDDWPVMQTAVASRSEVLVTNNSRDFPLGEERNGIRIVGSRVFLNELYKDVPGAEDAIREYLG